MESVNLSLNLVLTAQQPSDPGTIPLGKLQILRESTRPADTPSQTKSPPQDSPREAPTNPDHPSIWAGGWMGIMVPFIAQVLWASQMYPT